MAKTAVTPSTSALKALATAAVAPEREVKLTGTGGLFPKPSGVQAEALEICRSGSTPYLETVRTTTTKTKGKETTTEYVRITLAGLGYLIENTPQSEAGDFIIRCTSHVPEAEWNTILSTLEGHIAGPKGEVFAAAVNALEMESERRAVERNEASKRTQIERYRQSVVLKRQTAERLESQLVLCRKEITGLEAILSDIADHKLTTKPTPITSEPNAPSTTRATAATSARPESREDVAFRREVAGRLVSTWLESYRLNNPDGRRYLETAMGNMGGFKQVGEEGERTTFDGKYHESDVSVSSGAPVRVIRPGWVLEEDDGEYRIIPAKVSP